jgi:ankyrin repeat protein
MGGVYARKRLCHETSEVALARRLVNAIITSLTQPDVSPNLRAPTATQQLLALLSSAVPAHVTSADDADDSDGEETAAAQPACIQATHDAAGVAIPTAVQALLAQGADSNTRDADGNTPLYLAVHLPCLRAALEVVHLLLCRGADPHARRRGRSPLHHALCLERAPLVQRLLRSGAVPQRCAAVAREPHRRLAPFAARHGFGDEALQHMRAALGAAVKRDDHGAVRSLLQHGLPAEGGVLFALVRQRRSHELISAMLAGRADPNAADALGTHVLTLAALQSDCWLAQALLSAKADPNLEEEDGRSILALAREQCTDPTLLQQLEAAAAGPGREAATSSEGSSRIREPARHPASRKAP